MWEADAPGRAGGKAPWAGMALIEPDTTAMQVEVTTEANSLAIARPGGGPDPDILRIGMFAQLTNDPNVLSAQLALAVIFGLIQVLGAVVLAKRVRDGHVATDPPMGRQGWRAARAGRRWSPGVLPSRRWRGCGLLPAACALGLTPRRR